MGHCYANGRLLMHAGVDGAFIWNGGSTTDYALYATLVSSDVYTPDPRDTYLGVQGHGGVIPKAGEATAANCTTPRKPVYTEPIKTAHVDGPPSADYVLYCVDNTHSLSWTVEADQVMTAGWIVFYWDQNVSNETITWGATYDPEGTTGGTSNHLYDTACELIAYAPFIDSETGAYSWDTTTDHLVKVAGYSYDTGFTDATLLISQIK